MEEKKTMIWAGFDVGKETFSASLDQVSENGKAKITSLPCRDFKRTPEGLTKFFQWADGFVSGKDLHIVMETTGCYSQQLTDWINLSCRYCIFSRSTDRRGTLNRCHRSSDADSCR